MYNRLLRMGSEIVSRIRININKSLSTLYIDSPKTSLCENKASIAFMSMGKTKVPLEVSIREFFLCFLYRSRHAKPQYHPWDKGNFEFNLVWYWVSYLQIHLYKK